MQKTTIALALTLLLSGAAQAEIYALSGNRMSIEVETHDAKLTGIVFTNRENGDVIRTDQLFAIKRVDDTLLPSTEFLVESVSETDNKISINLKNKDFNVISHLSLDDSHGYSTVSWSL